MNNAQDPFLSVTAHYISAPTEGPQEWELHSKQLAFTLIDGNHSGANLASMYIGESD